MFTSSVITKTIALLAAVAATQAVPLVSRQEQGYGDDALIGYGDDALIGDDVLVTGTDSVDADEQPLFLLEIHPGNRTDLCLSLQSTIPPVANSSLALVDCDAVTPNNETAFYKYWTLRQSDEADENPAYGFQFRLNGTDLCLDTTGGIQDAKATLQQCREDALVQQFIYSQDKQINIPQTFTCLGLGEYNFPEIQDCTPDFSNNQTWTFEATPTIFSN